MTKSKPSHKIIALFLTLNFLTTIIPFNLIYAGNNGPGSPEAAGFEPVDATDMVNLATGDLSYVLPLLSVDGFPVSLSYHAGIPLDMDASWVGLGWYLNPGAINRSVVDKPDDWYEGVGINFTAFYDEVEYHSLTVGVGLSEYASVGVGINWGGGKGISGSIYAKVGMEGSPISATASVDTTGDVSVGFQAQIGGQEVGDVGGGFGASYSFKHKKTSFGAGIGVSTVENGFTGFSTNFKGGVSIGHQQGSGANGKNSSIGMSSRSFSAGDANVNQDSWGISVPIPTTPPFSVGYRKTKVKVSIRKGFRETSSGVLYANKIYNFTNNEVALIRNVGDNVFNDYLKRTRSMDSYSTRIPQPEEEFIGDYSKTIENINFTHAGYDVYSVAAQGLMGGMTPFLFSNAPIAGPGARFGNQHAFWHASNKLALNGDKSFGEGNNGYNKSDLYFYFNGHFGVSETNNVSNINSNAAINNNSFNSFYDIAIPGAPSGFSQQNYGRAKTHSFVETFTNKEIENGLAQSRGLILPKNIDNTLRNNKAHFDPDGIGGYKITASDGKTYHFTIPVYHFEQIQRSLINESEYYDNNINNVVEKRQYSRYATHWLLSALTGPDYVDTNNNGKVDSNDYGYWVELEYGKWSDGYVWRTPYNDKVYDYSTSVKGDIEDSDKGHYTFGRKQMYYLNKISTKEKTALFVKDIRYDAIGKSLNFKFNNNGVRYLYPTGHNIPENSLNKTDIIDVRETNVNYPSEKSLKLDKIILVNTEDAATISTNASSQSIGNLYGYTPNSTHSPNWNSQDFSNIYTSNYNYEIHQEKNVLDINDIPENYIENHALKVIKLNHSYNLAKKSPSSANAPNDSLNKTKGRLTLESVEFWGKGGANYMPPTVFDYYMPNYENYTRRAIVGTLGVKKIVKKLTIQDEIADRKEMYDSWGFMQGIYNNTSNANDPYNGQNLAKAWSLQSIKTPTGSKIDINYEEDDYWTEAFARRYWTHEKPSLVFKFENNGKLFCHEPDVMHPDGGPTSGYINVNVFRGPEIINNEPDFSFKDYFDENTPIYLDIWASKIRNYPGRGYRSAGLNVERQKATIVDLKDNEMKLNVFVEIYPGAEHQKGVNEALGSNYPDLNLPKEKQFAHDRYFIVEDDETPGENDTSVSVIYKILANRVPKNKTGGGLRVKELVTHDYGIETNVNKKYKVRYDYSHPEYNRSSGITSYAPVDGVKYVPYQSELPPPTVTYEYVTVSETTEDNIALSKMRYRHHVLKPVFDIFDPNIELGNLQDENDPNNASMDKIFSAKVQENYAGLNGTNKNNIEAKRIDINVNTSIIGQLKSLEALNYKDQVISKINYGYVNGTKLTDSNSPFKEPNKGVVTETFNSMKTVVNSGIDGKQILETKRLLSISSKTTHSNILRRVTSISGGKASTTEYSDVDPWLGSFRKSKTTLADNTETTTTRIPAYEKYTAMQPKALNPSNKNMLTQQTMTVTKIGANTSNASISTWKDNWTYRNNDGSEQQQAGVWRKHKTFAWKDDINPVTGTYATNVNESTPYFNWNTGSPTNNKWQETSEITRYSHWSMPLEVKDINNNFMSSKLSEDNVKIAASGNARYTEMYYYGVENPSEEIITSQGYETPISHSGDNAIIVQDGRKGFTFNNGNVGSGYSDMSKDFRPGKYKVSVWVNKNNNNQSNVLQKTFLHIYDKIIAPQEIVTAGCWSQLTYNFDLNPDTTFNLYLKNDDYSIIYDDFRLHPISSTINTFVYDKKTDELLYILDGNNMGSAFKYDAAGRLLSTYKEVENSGSEAGGFKLLKSYRYHYKDKEYPFNYIHNINKCN